MPEKVGGGDEVECRRLITWYAFGTFKRPRSINCATVRRWLVTCYGLRTPKPPLVCMWQDDVDDAAMERARLSASVGGQLISKNEPTRCWSPLPAGRSLEGDHASTRTMFPFSLRCVR